jgi:hypothetical protein
MGSGAGSATWTVAAAGYAVPNGAVVLAADAAREVATPAGDRGVRWFVSVYVLGVVGGSLVALIGCRKAGGDRAEGRGRRHRGSGGEEKDDLPF